MRAAYILIFLALLVSFIGPTVFALSDANLLAYYNFNESSGVLIDIKDGDNNGTNSANVVQGIAGKIGA